MIPVIRRSLTLTRDVPAGRRLVATDLVCMRPGTGVPPSALKETLGRILSVAKKAGEVLVPSDLT